MMMPTAAMEAAKPKKTLIEAGYTSARKDNLVKMVGFQAFDRHE